MTRSLFIFLVLLAALLAAFSKRARVSLADPDGMVSLAFGSFHSIIGYEKSPATWAYDLEI